MRQALCSGITLVALLHTSVCLHAQDIKTLPNEQLARVESLIQTQMTQSKIPALSLAVVSDDQVRYARGFGIADLEQSSKAKSTSVYRLGSLSKTLTAVAVMQLAERGKLDLDAPVQKYCPAFPEKPWPISARQLLAHLAGVRDYNNQKFLEEYFSTRHYNSIVEALDIFKNDPLLQEPGVKYSYSTYGYSVLGCVIEGASALSYEEYMRENIFKPNGMGQTGIDEINRLIADRARGYRLSQKGEILNTSLADTSNKIPGGGLVSTVEDIARFAIALRTGKLVGAATVDQMWTAQKTKDGKAFPYGLGWRIAERNGTKEVFHGGAAAGFSTFLYLLPEKRIAIVLMANLELLGQKDRDDLARKIADVLTG